MSQIYKALTSGPVPPDVPTSFVTDDGTVVPSGNIVNVNGGTGVRVIANATGSNNMVIQLTDVATSYVNVTPSMSPYAVLTTDYFISCDTTADGGGPITIQLLNSPTQYDQFVVKDRTGGAAVNNITVTTAGGVILIDGATSQTFVDPYESLELLWNGASYESF
jgi:hypothetical protein